MPSYGGDNQVMCLRYRPASGTAYNVLSTAKIPTGVWAHVALTFNWDGTSGNVTIYLNGANVGTGTMPFNPTLLGSTADNYLAYSRWAQDTNGFNGTLDDVRFYNRALTQDDILYLSGLAELNLQYSNLTATTLKPDGDLKNVTSNLNLPTTLGTKGVKVDWASTNRAVVDTLGNVHQPEKYNAPAKLTAKLSQVVNNKTYTMVKEFNVIVTGIIPTPDEIAQWDFQSNAITVENGETKVTDTKSGYVGVLKNDARIRTIGNTTQYNVLDLGNGTGYFDMGTEIGKAVYSLTDYTVCGFFRIDEDYASLGSAGNFYWTFSNSADSGTDQNGYMIGSLKGTSQSVSTNYWNNGNQSTNIGTTAPQGAWHHMAYVQTGNTGTLYIDGEQKALNTGMTNLPGFAIPKAGFTGTLYNWLGRSNYVSDVYLRKTLLYDFRLFAVPLGLSDINLDILMVPSMREALTTAYAENPDYIATELTTEKEHLTLPNLDAVTADLNLPSKGTLDPSISIVWSSTNNNLISPTGKVTRPNYYNYNDTLKAILIKNGQAVSKLFPAKVIAKEGTAFANSLLVKYDFSQVTNDTIITDVAEKQLQGVTKNEARVHSIGITKKFNVLDLGEGTGYFDMGKEIGKLMYNLSDFTVSAYYRVDDTYEELTTDINGNFLWSFSNATDILTNAKGYLIYSLKNNAATISPSNWNAEQTVRLGEAGMKGGWHNITYTQAGTTGTLYVDGTALATGEISQLPFNTLYKSALLGTEYNWIGRSCYAGDVYLRKAMVHDFRLYSVALTPEQIESTELNVGNKINELDVAYAENATALPSVNTSSYSVTSSKGMINVIGLKDTDKVTVFDIAGRPMNQTTQSSIRVNPGIYIVRINDFAVKVAVK
ncbi:MAG: hypothetical protein QM751_01140 [Paludibacteraceae bacterium]